MYLCQGVRIPSHSQQECFWSSTSAMCSQTPRQNGGKVGRRKFKCCLLSEQVKTSNVSGLCVLRGCGVGERRVSAVGKRLVLEKLESLRYEAAQKMKLWSPSFVSYDKDSPLPLLGKLGVYDGKAWITWKLRRKRWTSSSQGNRDHLCQHWQPKSTAETETPVSRAQEDVCLLSHSYPSVGWMYITILPSEAQAHPVSSQKNLVSS